MTGDHSHEPEDSGPDPSRLTAGPQTRPPRADRVHCFTSASLSYLDRVRVLGTTLRRSHPDWHFTLCLVDREPPGFHLDLQTEPFDRLLRIDDLSLPDAARWIFKHDLIELCTAVKGDVLCRLLDEGAEKVIYLDPDIALLSPLEEAITLLDRFDVLLTPHQLDPDDEAAAIVDNEISTLRHGVYNLGFVAVSNRAEGRRFAHWWRDRLRAFCRDDIPGGLFTDQRWCDLVPAFFEDVHILKHPGYNVASWNLSRRPVTIGPDGIVRASGQPIRFFHFTKVLDAGQTMIERYSGGLIEVFELLEWYLRELRAQAVPGLPAGWWAFGHYADGRLIPAEHRAAYRTDQQLQARVSNPFLAADFLYEHTQVVS